MATLKGFARFIYETDIDNLPDEIKTGTISFSSTMTGDDYQNGVSQEIGPPKRISMCPAMPDRIRVDHGIITYL